MRVAYLDCFSGIAGDMCAGALLDAGVPFGELRSTLDSLPVRGFEISIEPVRRASIHALRFDVRQTEADPGHRGLSEILSILEGGRLPPRVLADSKRVFELLAASESRAHAIPVEAVHFHEVGAIDCIVDVVSACFGLHWFGVERVFASPPPTGAGFVRCAHGLMPLPTPGALGALIGRDVVFGGPPMELTTPTGAALLGALAESAGEELALRVEAIGHGAGARDLEERPNFLRAVIGTLDAAREHDEVVELATNLDQASPEILGYVLERALALGALDAWIVPAQMKKSRAGAVLHVLARPEGRVALEDLIFRETRTLGIRRQRLVRSKLARAEHHVHLGDAEIGIKSRRLPDGTWRHQPEFDDVRRVAERTGAPFWDVWEAALHAVPATFGAVDGDRTGAAEPPHHHQHSGEHGHDHGHEHGHRHEHGHEHGHEPGHSHGPGHGPGHSHAPRRRHRPDEPGRP